MKNRKFALAVILISLFFLQACNYGHSNKSKIISIRNGNLTVMVDASLRTKITSKKQLSPLNTDFNYSEYLETRHNKLKKFIRRSDTNYVVNNKIGKGKAYIFSGLYHKGKMQVEKYLRITVYDSFPDMAVYNSYYVNMGEKLGIRKYVSHHYDVLFSPGDTLVWSFQGGTTDARDNWIRPVSDNFFRGNYQGMTSTDYGGGIPVTDVWRRDVGVAIGSLNMFPLRISLPVEADDEIKGVDISIQKKYNDTFEFTKGDTLRLPETFVAVHTGDFFSSLREFSLIMRQKGMTFHKPEKGAFEPIWCAWGYGRGVTPSEIIGTLTKVKELGFKWVVIDDGYQRAIGDWRANKKTYPEGDKQIKALVDKIHAQGLKVKIWYTPMIISPFTKLMEHNPEISSYAKVPKDYQDVLLLNKDGSPRYVTWWDSYYMGPTFSKTISLTKKALHRFFVVWGVDGVKLDGQFQNAVPPDYNPEHHLKYPAQASHELPGFFEMIFNTVRKMNPNAVIENCPGGTVMSFYNMTTVNQTVASDPTSSFQIRSKGKVYKALLFNKIAYYGDHVELSDGGDDFASTIGIGGVPGSKFTWPKDNPNPTEGDFLLTPVKEKIWKKWISIYNQKMLSKAVYLGSLYDMGFDKPETHVLQKGDTLFYSFYANKWYGKIELKGLDQNKDYKVYDYVNRKNLGIIKGKSPFLEASFQKHLLIEVYPNRK